jgi:hypothetical protein
MAKRRTFLLEFKAQVVLEVLTGAKIGAQICREHQIKDTILTRWKQEFIGPRWAHPPFITVTRAFSTPPRSMSIYCAVMTSRSAWPIKEKPGRMATLSG